MSEICTVNDESLARAVEIIHDGGLVVIPTDTVYGVACDPRNIEAIRKVFATKQRPKYKSLPGVAAVNRKHGEAASDLAGAAQPSGRHVHAGRFSPIAEAEDDCSLATLRHDPTTGKATQGVRIPNSAVALRILRATGPLAATSANRSGEESAQTVRKPRTRWEMRWICIWTGERLRDMCRPRWSPPTRTSATASRFFGRE